MSVKLSELLGDIARTLEDSDWVYEINYGETLRAIAPALVELVATKTAINGLDPDHEYLLYTDLAPRLMKAWGVLLSAMKAAGVTCE